SSAPSRPSASTQFLSHPRRPLQPSEGPIVMKHSTRLVLVAFAGLDILFGPLITFAFLQLLQVDHTAQAAAIMMALLVVKMLAVASVTVASLRHYEAFASADKAHEKAAFVRAADLHLQAFPTRISLSWT